MNPKDVETTSRCKYPCLQAPNWKTSEDKPTPNVSPGAPEVNDRTAGNGSRRYRLHANLLEGTFCPSGHIAVQIFVDDAEKRSSPGIPSVYVLVRCKWYPTYCEELRCILVQMAHVLDLGGLNVLESDPKWQINAPCGETIALHLGLGSKHILIKDRGTDPTLASGYSRPATFLDIPEREDACTTIPCYKSRMQLSSWLPCPTRTVRILVCMGRQRLEEPRPPGQISARIQEVVVIGINITALVAICCGENDMFCPCWSI